MVVLNQEDCGRGLTHENQLKTSYKNHLCCIKTPYIHTCTYMSTHFAQTDLWDEYTCTLACAGGDCIGLLSRIMCCSCLSFLYAAGISVILLQEKSSRIRGRSASSASTDEKTTAFSSKPTCRVLRVYSISPTRNGQKSEPKLR